MDDSVDLNSLSKVDYLSDHENYRCGYCGQSDTNSSHGMWAYDLTVEDYQALIDRGWRRSGKYVYKPNMQKTCCPQYTIKCEALKFKLRDSHKKVIRRINNYLNTGTKSKHHQPDHDFSTRPETKTSRDDDAVTPMNIDSAVLGSCGNESSNAAKSDVSESSKVKSELGEGEKMKVVPKPGLGADPTKPACRKAKEIRRERWLAKHSKEETKVMPKPGSAEKTLAERLSDIQENPCHRLETRMVRSSPRSHLFNKTFAETYEVYKKYQMTIHNDPPDKPTEKQFTRFLVDSPLKLRLVRSSPRSSEYTRTRQESYEVYKKYQMIVHHDPPSECDLQSYTDFLVESPLVAEYWDEGSDSGYGSFHQQYLLDGKIIAVGVVDILPKCVSSVYLYYDPDYAFLTLGTYSALKEVSLVQQLNSTHHGIEFYYMGFYIHSCPKMKYKGQYLPSYLLCPEAYSWHSIDKCAPILDNVSYSRFSPPGADEDEEGDLSRIICVYRRSAVRYGVLAPILSEDARRKVKEYVSLAGHECASRMLLLLA